MTRKSLQFSLLLATALGLGGCATQTPPNRGKLASVRSVAVNYSALSGGLADSTGGRVAGRVARHGAGYALGQLGFVGGLIGLAVDVTDIVTPSGGEKISGTALRLLRETGTEPLALVARETEREISRRRLFALSGSNPDAVFDLELRRLQIDPVDSRALNHRASLAVTARLVDRKGVTLWKKDAVATSVRAHTWRDYSEQPRLARADFDALAATVARQLLSEMRSSRR